MKNTRLKTILKDNFSFTDAELTQAFNQWTERQDNYSNEAVNSFGGFKALIKAARHVHRVNFKREKAKKVEALKNITIKLHHDDDAESPRDWDNLGTMVCFHNSYILGDKSDLSMDDLNEVVKRKDVLALPLYLMDHGQVSMRTGGYGCRWDSGQVGYIFIEKAKIRKEYSVKKVSKKLAEQVLGYLKSEVETYSLYLQGEVYGYEVLDGDNEVLDSCWGFIGHDNAESEAEASAKFYKGGAS